MELLPPGIHLGVPDSVYRSDPGYNQSTLVDFLTSPTPKAYLAKVKRKKKELEDKDFIRIGAFVDCALTEPGEVNKRFFVTPATYTGKGGVEKPWTRKSDKCKEVEAEQKAAGFVCLTPPEFERALKTIQALHENEDTAAALKFCHKQVVIIAEHPTLGYRMKGKLDLLPPVSSLIGGLEHIIDIKTGEDASEDAVRRQCIRLWRHFQARYYINLLHYAAPDAYRAVSKFALFVAETDEPHDIQCHEFSLGFPELENVQGVIDGSLRAYHKCVTTDEWPGYSKEWKRISYPSWATREMEAVNAAVI